MQDCALTKHSLGGSDSPAAPNPYLLSGLPQFWRFLITGLFNALAGFILFLLFFGVFGWHYLISNILVFLSWAWFGHELQRRWVFGIPSSRRVFLKYVVNQVAFMLSGTAILWVLVEFGAVRPETAYVVTIGTITVGIYLSSRLWVFRRPRQGHRGVSQGYC